MIGWGEDRRRSGICKGVAVTDEDEEDEEDDIVWRESDGSDTIKNPITIEKIVFDFGFLKNSQESWFYLYWT